MRKRSGHNRAWRIMRRAHLDIYPECRVCGDTDDPVAHHLRYRGKRGESERPGDLVTLCRWHHDDFHRTLGRRGTGVEATIDYIGEKRAELEHDDWSATA